MNQSSPKITDSIGKLPYRMAFAGGWIDQPFMSQLNPEPPGSMVVVSIEPTCRFMDRCGMGTSTRKVAASLWGDHIPPGDPSLRVRELYTVENQGKAEPSGSQDMAGLIYPGVNRLDYDFSYEGGYFPIHVESCCDTAITRWLSGVIYMLPMNQRPDGYSPLGIKNLDPEWIHRLGRSGKACYEAILAKDLRALGASMNESMACWQVLLPHTVSHPTITVDLLALLGFYQARYAGAMYSGCGGGYLYVVSDRPVQGGFQVKVRV
jgi:hypothetical protein